MAKRERPISVLWIDDQISELKEFPQYAASQRVIIRNSFESAEEGIEELTQNVNKYQAVILDAKAFRKKGQAKGTENFKSLRDSINNIRQLEKDLNRKIPHCVYTGHIDKMGEAWEDDLKIFIKGKDQDNLLQFLKDEIKNLPETKIVQHYSEAFEAFENKLDATLKGSLIYVLGNLDSKQQQVIKNSLVEMRKILEGIYLDLCTQKYLHPICLQNGRPNLEYCQRFLAGLDVKNQ